MEDLFGTPQPNDDDGPPIRIYAVLCGILIGAFAICLVVASCSGCGSWNGIDVKIRPGGHPDTKATVPPPTKEPDPYDWEPWWSRPRPKPTTKISEVGFQKSDVTAEEPPPVGQETSSEQVGPWHHKPHQPGPVIEVVSVFWKYFKFPLTIFEGVQHCVMLFITCCFIYGMSKLGVSLWRGRK